jgi:hypothetical protein
MCFNNDVLITEILYYQAKCYEAKVGNGDRECFRVIFKRSTPPRNWRDWAILRKILSCYSLVLKPRFPGRDRNWKYDKSLKEKQEEYCLSNTVQKMGMIQVSIIIVIRLRAAQPGFYSRQGQGIFLFATASRLTLGPIQTPIQWFRGDISTGQRARGVKLTTRLHLAPRIRMHGAVPPFTIVIMMFCLVKYRNNFTFTLPTSWALLSNQVRSKAEWQMLWVFAESAARW